MSSDKEFSDAMKNGVRFWCPATCSSADPAFKVADEAFPKRKGVAYTPGEYRSMKHRIHIVGEDWFTKSALVFELAQVAKDEKLKKGLLRWNPQEAIDKGILTIEQMESIGYKGLTPRGGAVPATPLDAVVRTPTEPEIKVQEAAPTVNPIAPAQEEVLPDFDTMGIVELREWADKHGIFLDGRWGKETSVKKVQDALKDSAAKG